MSGIQNDGMIVFSTKKVVMFNSAGELINDSQKLRKHTKNRSVIYSVFEEMKEYNESSYWDEQLTNFSRGNFPRNFKFYTDTLHYRAKKKNGRKEFFLDTVDLNQTLIELKEFLEDKGVVSILERKEKLLSEYEIEEKFDAWKDFKLTQMFLVEKYIDKLTKKLDLDEKLKINLESVIKFGISCDIFNNDTIKIKEAKIKKIKHLEWDDDEKRFFIDFSSAKPKFYSGTGRKSKSSKSVNPKSGKYSSHTFSGETFRIKTHGNIAKVCDKWKEFLNDFS
jgi:hypothetical protein